MLTEEQIDAITTKILMSRKYRYLYPPTVGKAVEDASEKYPAKRVEKVARTHLHQAWGAFVGNPSYNKALGQIREEIAEGKHVKAALRHGLILQTSTRERLRSLDTFYGEIFQVTGPPSRIVEYGCGMNPLTVPWMGEGIEYLGFDIDGEMMKFVNDAAKAASLIRVNAKPGDILIDLPVQADVTLLLKLIPLIEHQTNQSVSLLLEAIPSKQIVVSFPTASISGKKKGMTGFYTERFTKEIPRGWNYDLITFESEIVFVLERT
jgi:hypothetical protein